MITNINALRDLQSQTQEELDALSSSPSAASGIPSVLDRAYQGDVMDGKVAVEEIKQKFETVGHPVSIHFQKGRSFGASMTDEGAMVDWKWIAGFMLTLISSILGVLSWLSNRKKPAREERPVPSPRERKKQP